MPEEMDEMRGIINDFVAETGELVDLVTADLVALEKAPENIELINKIFRNVHTIKGAAGFLGFGKIVDIVHHSENILNKCRQELMKVTPGVNDSILKSMDAIRFLASKLQNQESIDDVDTVAITHELEEALNARQETAPTAMRKPLPPPTPSTSIEEERADTNEELEDMDEHPILPSKLGELLVDEEIITHDQLQEALQQQAQKEQRSDRASMPRLGEILIHKKVISKNDLDKALNIQSHKPSEAFEQTIRIDLARLDDVMNLVGELVLGRNRLMRTGAELEQAYENDSRVEAFMDTMTHINMVTTDLQLSVMKTRMQPIRKVFNRFSRMIRDLAKTLHKEIVLEVEGEETELDKAVIEEVADPLVHIVRNAVDHGIELPDEREACGKPREGTIRLRAFHEGNNIVLEIQDDGRGMDVEEITKEALDKGLIQASDLEHLSERDRLNFIFSPGFSTASDVTEISGRGVGMDIVKANVAKLNGTILITTSRGEGTSLYVRLPLTVAIIQALMVGVGNETFALPLTSVHETMRVHKSSIQHVDQQEVIRLRDDVLPLARLGRIFDVPMNGAQEADFLYVVVLGIAEKKVGLMVEELIGQEEVVIKPLGTYIQSKGIAGASVLGNGKVTLIVDLGGLMEIIEEAGTITNLERSDLGKKVQTYDKKEIVLVVDDSPAPRRNLKNRLELEGYGVIEAANGKEGLEKLDLHPEIDVVITDLLMSGMNGFQLVQRIKAINRFAAKPIIALTVLETKEDMEAVQRIGIDGYFHKSNISAILGALKKAIR